MKAETPKSPSKSPVKDPFKDATKEPAKEPPKEGAKEGEEKKAEESETKPPGAEDNLKELQGVMSELEDEQKAKKDLLGGMDKLLKRILHTTKKSVEVQVGESDLPARPAAGILKDYVRESTEEGGGLLSEKSNGAAAANTAEGTHDT